MKLESLVIAMSKSNCNESANAFYTDRPSLFTKLFNIKSKLLSGNVKWFM
jgi:hypothetical protein